MQKTGIGSYFFFSKPLELRNFKPGHLTERVQLGVLTPMGDLQLHRTNGGMKISKDERETPQK